MGICRQSDPCLCGEPQRGSIPLALLMSILVGGLVSVVAAATIAGERSARFDQSFTGVLHVAETGVHEALHLLNTGQLQPGETGSGTTDGHDYDWEAEAFVENDDGDLERIPAEGQEDFANLDVEARDIAMWRLTGEGTMGDVSRTIELDVAVKPLFDLAAFTDQLMDLAGTNVADSYMSSNEGANERAWCTQVGRIGTNDVIDFGNGAGEAVCPYEDSDGELVWGDDLNNDGVDLYDWANDPDPDRCGQDDQENKMNNCWWEGTGNPRFATHDEYRDLDADLAWMDEALATCQDGGGPDGHFEVSDSVATAKDGGDYYELGPATSTTGYEAPFGDMHFYCYDSVTFDEDTRIAGSMQDPVMFVTEGAVTFRREGSPKRIVVNCIYDDGGWCDVEDDEFDPTGGYDKDTGADDPVYPEAGALQIYTTVSTDTAVDINQQSAVAATIYAHKGSCGAANSNASVDYFGALVCGDMVNAGGWRFHYDEALSDFVAVPNYAVDAWREP